MKHFRRYRRYQTSGMTKRIRNAISALLALLCITGCAGDDRGKPITDDTASGEVTAVPADVGIYSDAYSPGEIMDYFFEVAFGSEYGTSSDRLCRWVSEIHYEIIGDCTESDRELMDYLFETLNSIDGFPGIRAARFGERVNFKIYFVTRDELYEMFEYANEDCTGMSEYSWRTETCEIFEARAAIDCEETYERESTICEEILQSMGIGNDSMSYQNSVFFQGTCLYKRPSSLDIAVVELLYSPALSVGMTKAEAIPVAASALRW